MHVVGMDEGCFYKKKGCTFGKTLRRGIILLGGSWWRWRCFDTSVLI